MKNSLLSRLVFGVLLGSVLAGCPAAPGPDPLPPAPRVLSFTASQSSVAAGTTVTLSWNTENADTVKIDELKLGTVSGVSGASGQVDVTITDDSLFVITARNQRGASDTAVVAVRLAAGTSTVLFTALPTLINAGDPVTLAWSAPGASAVQLVATPGGPIDLAGQTTSGSVVVNPTADTSYTLSAGASTATASVSVRPTILSFGASTLSADAGSTITLSWTTASATRVQLQTPGRGTLVDVTDAAQVASGSFDDVLPTEIDPGQLFPYELVISGPGGSVSDSVVVSISGHPAVLTFEVPKYAKASTDGGVITLSWTTRDADAVSLSTNGAQTYRAPPSAIATGSVQVPAPSADTTYELVATNSRGGSASKTGSVEIVGLPTVTLTATPDTITPGQPVTLSWAGTDVRNVRIVSNFGATLFRGTDTADTGTAPNTVTFGNTAVLRIEADNGLGDLATATATVTVTNGVTLTQPPGALRAGEPVALSWTGGATITGLPHSDVVVRSGSTGFDDISTTGTALVFASTDDAVALIEPVDFSAPFFDRMVGDQVWVATNGYLSFAPIGPRNYVEAALPSTKLEPYSIAADWDDLFSVSGYWQVKPLTGTDKVLIVQWAVGTSKSFQVKVYSSGQIDLEYRTWTGTSGSFGVEGPNARWGFPLTTTPAADLGFTLFGPKTSPATVTVADGRTLVATMSVSGLTLPITHDLGPVVQANELSVSEALVAPAAAVGAPGQWFELFNARDTAIDLTGWSLVAADGGTSAALSGQVPARGVVVLGASTDPALNDDAGVQLALTGLDTGLADAGSVTLARNGPLSTYAWANPTPGTALVSDYGPYKLSTEASALAPHPQTCLATTSFGSQGQLGAPGQANHCGFGYAWQATPGRFFDISRTGTAIALSSVDEGFGSVSLAAAPFPFFGTAQTAVRVSSNGFLAFDAAGSNSSFTTNSPSTSDANGLLVPFGGNLIGDAPGAGVFVQRVGPNVDPFAAPAHWIIQWSKWTHYSNSSYFDDLNFEVKLFDDGTFDFQYGTMVSTSSGQYGAGISSVTWVENPAGTQALVLNANSFTPGITPNSGFRFSPR